MSSHRQRGLEHRLQAADSSPIHRSIGDDEQARDGPAVEAALARDLQAQPELAIEGHERSLGIRDDRLDLDDQDRPRGHMPSEDVNGAAVSEAVERHLHGDIPASRVEFADEPVNQDCVRLVEEPVESLAVPSDANVELGAEGSTQPLQPLEVSRSEQSTFDIRDE